LLDQSVFPQLSDYNHTVGAIKGNQHPIELMLQVALAADLFGQKAWDSTGSHGGLNDNSDRIQT
jgi:hypothetical protein